MNPDLMALSTEVFRLRHYINHVTPEILPENVHEPYSSPSGYSGLNVFHEQSPQFKGYSRFSSDITSLTTMPQIAVVLSGCGVYDGTEVHEAAAALGIGKRKRQEYFFILNF